MSVVPVGYLRKVKIRMLHNKHELKRLTGGVIGPVDQMHPKPMRNIDLEAIAGPFCISTLFTRDISTSVHCFRLPDIDSKIHYNTKKLLSSEMESCKIQILSLN